MNITIEDSKIHDTGRDCIKVTPGSDGLTIRRTEIYNSGKGYPTGTSPDDMNAEGIDAVNADNMLVQAFQRRSNHLDIVTWIVSRHDLRTSRL